MNTGDKLKEHRMSQYHVLSVLSLLIMGVGISALVVTLYLYDTGVKGVIETANIVGKQNNEQISQHDNITKQLGDQLRQHEQITHALTVQLDQLSFITSGLKNVTEINTIILESVNQTVTDEDLEKSVSVKIDALKRSIDEFRNISGDDPLVNGTGRNQT